MGRSQLFIGRTSKVAGEGIRLVDDSNFAGVPDYFPSPKKRANLKHAGNAIQLIDPPFVSNTVKNPFPRRQTQRPRMAAWLAIFAVTRT